MIRALAIVCLVATGALADPATDEAATRFDRGVKFYEHGDNLAALAEFSEAYKLTGRWEILFNIGVTQKKLFRYGEAMHTFAKYLADGGAKIPADRRAEIERAEVEIHESVAEVTVTVAGAPAEIAVDQLAVGTSPLVEPLLIAPGRHEVSAHRAGELDAKQIEVVSGQKSAVELAPRPETPKTARLTIATTPTGGSLVVDQHPTVTAPWSAIVASGIHDVSATMIGRVPVKREVQIVGGQDRTISIDFALLPPPPPPPTPFYKRWYFFAAIGAVVIGGTIGIYEATRTRTDVLITVP